MKNEMVKLNSRICFHVVLSLVCSIFMIGNGYARDSNDRSNGTVVVKTKSVLQDTKRQITGKIVDGNQEPIIGANILEVGTSNGTISDVDGEFKLLIGKTATLRISYIGYIEQTVVIAKDQVSVSIIMKEDAQVLEDVVVTGYFTKKKESYTGSAISYKGEDLQAVASNNLLEALTSITPGMVMVEQTESGSNPNRVPELLIRGVTSFSGTNQSVNQPLVVRDGTIISIQDLYDMNINEIESVTILKDASAAALYGSRAANGVIVIERKKIKSGKMRIAFNTTNGFQFPDFSDYNILNASDKLEYERLAGLYTSENNEQQYELDRLYNKKLKEINRGVSTDWIRKPARVGFTTDNSLRIFGGSGNTRYELNARLVNTQGVMKGDYRKRYGLGFLLEYYAPMGFSFSNRTTLSRIDSKNSPYGSFQTYTRMNPYDRVYDTYGKLIKTLSWNQANPLYEAELGSFYKTGNRSLSNDFDARWNINDKFRITVHFNFTLGNGNNENFISPLSNQFKDQQDLSQKGSMSISDNKSFNYSGNIVMSYNKFLPQNSLLSLNAGGNINRIDLRTYNFMGIGFYSDDLRSINFASQYPQGQKPAGNHDLSADVQYFANANYLYDNRYFVDGVYQISGSSKFGSNNRYGHFWSSGIGWNLHNEKIFKSKSINIMKLRASMGYTGKISFASYQAMTTYVYQQNLGYLNGIGAIPLTVGNPDLKWERTLNYNLGFDLSLWDNRFNLTTDIYKKITTDLLIDKTLPPSTGTMSGKENLGEMENTGIEVRMDGFIVKTKDWLWQLGTTVTHNKNKILKISDALKRQNDINNKLNTIAPLPQFQEGESTTALKVVQSMGIDPATGKEVFLKRNGDKTFVYDPHDKIVVGDQLPIVMGTLFSNATYKRWTLSAYFNYRFGGHIYNITRATKIEGADPKFNADKRVFDDRWKKSGDIAYYKDIANMSRPYHTTRFVEKENTLTMSRLNLTYEAPQSFIENWKIAKLAIGVSVNDLFRISSVKMERGTDYLFSRGFDINLNIMF